MKRGIVLKSIEISPQSSFEPNRGIVDYECKITLRIQPEPCKRCNYLFIPTKRNKTCLVCLRKIDRIKLEKMELLMRLLY